MRVGLIVFAFGLVAFAQGPLTPFANLGLRSDDGALRITKVSSAFASPQGPLANGANIRLRADDGALHVTCEDCTSEPVDAFAAAASPVTVTSAYGVMTCNATAGAVTFNLPTAVGIEGRIYTMKKIDAVANACTLDGSGAQTIDGAATLATSTQWARFTIISDGANWLVK